MCDASYVTYESTDNTEDNVIFARKYKTLQNVNILGARFYSSGTSFFSHFRLKHHWANFKQTWHKASLGEGDSSLLK